MQNNETQKYLRRDLLCWSQMSVDKAIRSLSRCYCGIGRDPARVVDYVGVAGESQHR